MTEREAQIIEYIKQNPFITQQQLADVLGIERSSVAVHISNLSKKGIIKGKGYIIETTDYVVVIGGSNMDILGTPHQQLIMGDSNPGTISLSPGGVGRNIAENLSYLGLDVKFLSAVGQDVYGEQLIKETSASGVDMHYVSQPSNFPTSIYMSILDETGDMKAAVSHMDITTTIDTEYVMKNKALIENARYIVIDLNLTTETIAYIMGTFSHVPIIVDTVSVTKSVKIQPYLNHIYSIKPNRQEAEAILGRRILTDNDCENALFSLHKAGVMHPMISLGKDGIAYLQDGTMIISPSLVTDIVNANGAGDAFTAGITYGFHQSMDFDEAIHFGQKAASLALSSKETVGGQHLFKSLIKGE